MYNIFLRDLVLEHESYFCTNYANDTTPYLAGNNITEVVENLTNITQKLFTGFTSNQIKENLGKCHLLLSTQEETNNQVADTTIEYSRSQKLLGTVIDKKLKLELHIGNICKKASKH